MVEKVETKAFTCEYCKKNYKDKSGLWYHNKKYHSIDTTQTSSQLPQNHSSNEDKKISTKKKLLDAKRENTKIIKNICTLGEQ